MNQREIAEIVNGVLKNETIISTTSKVKIDSREICPGDIFIAIKGKTLDGHQYVKQAEEKHAGVIIVSNHDTSISCPLIVVDDTLDAFFKLAKYHKEKVFHGKVIAVTGSVGKTTTKEMIAHILETTYPILKSKGNFNNHIGLPLTLLELKETDKFCVVELGMNHANEISKLSQLCQPDISVITKIGSAHIGYLGSMQNILKAKLEIIDGMSQGVLLLNGDDTYLKKIKHIKNQVSVIRCGKRRFSKLRAYDVVSTIDTLSFKVKIKKIPYQFQYPHGGIHFLNDLLLAIEVGILCQVEIEKIIEAVNSMPAFEKRMEQIELKKNNILIDDTYNASMESVFADLDYLNQFPKKKIIFFGDILEVGDHGQKIHTKIAKKLKKMKDTEVICIGDESKVIPKHVKHSCHYETIGELLKTMEYANIEDTVILVKGSRKMGLEQIVNKLKEQYYEE